jgi:hypothetical protein
MARDTYKRRRFLVVRNRTRSSTCVLISLRYEKFVRPGISKLKSYKWQVYFVGELVCLTIGLYFVTLISSPNIGSALNLLKNS